MQQYIYTHNVLYSVRHACSILYYLDYKNITMQYEKCLYIQQALENMTKCVIEYVTSHCLITVVYNNE